MVSVGVRIGFGVMFTVRFAFWFGLGLRFCLRLVLGLG